MSKKLFLLTILFVLLTQTSPLIIETPKFMCSRDAQGVFDCWGYKFSEKTLFYSRTIIIFAIVSLYGLIQYFQIYRPLRKYSETRNDVFDALLAKSLDDYIDQGFSLRINVMKATRPILFLGLVHRLDTVYRYGFEPKHRDSHVKFYIVKFRNWAQGNCGEAFLNEKPQLADLTEGIPYGYNMSKKKIRQTEYIKGIISIPIFRRFTRSSESKVIGVINIDTNDESLVKEWVDDEDCLRSIIDAFESHAKLVSNFI